MKSKQAATFNNYPLMLMIFGISIYIAVDSGLLTWTKQKLTSFSQPPMPAQIATPQETLLAYSEKLNGELNIVEADLKKEREKLADLQSRTAEYQRDLASQKSNLAAIQTEIKNLSRLKSALVKAQGLSGSRITPGSISKLGQAISKRIGGKVAIETVNLKDTEYYRMASEITFDSEQAAYITPKGLTKAVMFAEGSLGLGFDSLSIAHRGSDEQIEERVGTLKRFLEKRYGNQLRISSLLIDDGRSIASDNGDGIELWTKKGVSP